jgi:anti-sigma-K factor RskA
MTHDRDMRELAALYAVGRLDPADAERFERHLADGCDACQAALLEAHGTASELATLLPAAPPSARARDAMFARVRADADARAAKPAPAVRGAAPRPAVRERRWMTAVGFAAAAAVLVALGLRTAALQRAVDARSGEIANTRAQLESRLADARAELDQTRARLEGQVAQAEAVLGAITSPGTTPVSLAGQGERKQASATAYLDAKAGRLMLFVRDLPPPAPGKTYQLWVIVEGKPVSLGIFDVGAEGRARMGAEKLPELRGPITIAVTEEPAGGVPQPTGPMVLAGS